MAATGQANKRGIGGLLKWRGLMGDATRGVRITSIAFLIILSCSMVATQTNYLVIGSTHVIAVLAPITAGSLLFGTMSGAIIGTIAGLAEMLHATLLPLDAYEAYFAAPTNSVFLFALIGIVMGVLFAIADRRRNERGDLQGLLVLASACLTGSVLFTFVFSVSVNAINDLLSLSVPSDLLSDFTGNREVISQIVADFILMMALSTTAGALDRNIDALKGEHTLRATFQGWLAVVVSMAYLITAALGYTFISSSCLMSANNQIKGQIDYLAGQLERSDQMLEGIARRSQFTSARIEELHESTIGGIATGLPLGEHGVSVIAEDGTIVSSSEESFLGQSFEEVVGNGLQDGFDESIYDRPMVTRWYMGGSKLEYLRATQVGYMRMSKAGNYQVMAALPATEVFTWRSRMMIAFSLVFIALFATVYVQAMLLLKNVVVRGIDETNATLKLITQGDLDQRVSVRDSVEFVSLSSGINATVSALKNAIAEEAGRIDRDLSTARSIQESALPQTFPPFPEVDAFDIYASMSPAREVGGDFYDFFLLDNHTLGFLIADVSGKGIPASLFMMAAKTELANYMSSDMDLAEAIQTANWHLCQGNEAGMFVTVWAATLDYETGELIYVNAGHNPPLLRHNGRWDWLQSRGGLFLGTFDTAKFRSSTLKLSRGDQLLLYTDGVTEAFNARDEQYGGQRLEEFLMRHTDMRPHAITEALRDDVHAWANGTEQSDDITILSLEYGSAPEVRGSITVDATLDQLDDVLDFIHEELGRRRCPIVAQNQLDVAIEELFVNVCNYAYEGSDSPGTCRIEYIYRPDPATITVQITDWGTPFNPLAQDDPNKPTSIADTMIGGLGIFMAKQLTDDMSYVRDGNANVVAISKSW
uniref:Putative phosphoprotein phosphatase n=1 Tax=uncultured bacterium Contigcl_1738 TaxID=1393655 RepID=W0FM96_9BACT|nr:putative phosphoprotein phosphatase [uncultured bacterium Contigcl_1738]